MTTPRHALADYLALRRAMGTGMERAERLLGQFVTYLEERGAATISIEHALAWATAPAGGSAWWWSMRLTHARGFARYLTSIDPATEVPPVGLIAYRRTRATPYLYSDADIAALVAAAAGLPRRMTRATYPALISLLAVTGLRVGEALALDNGDLDEDTGVLTVRSGKLGKSRLLPLHPSTVAGLRAYQATRDRLLPAAVRDALFVSTTGTRLSYIRVDRTFRKLTRQTGLAARSATCHPRVHDLRHAFAVKALLACYRRGEDPRALMPRLATYLGHVDPRDTYWYLSAAPELLALAAHRLDQHLGPTR